MNGMPNASTPPETVPDSQQLAASESEIACKRLESTLDPVSNLLETSSNLTFFSRLLCKAPV
jgi:hypothetical protein